MPISMEARPQRMNETELLYQNMTRAFRDKYPEDGRRMVYGEGPEASPRLMLIGEAPGGQE